jgi:gliding motility-associated-like protein
VDSGLVNGTNYCYKIKGLGLYSAPGFPEPLVNWSQVQCGTPYDNLAPCPPSLWVNLNCELVQNELTWTNPNSSCTDDVAGYHVYYSPVQGGDFTLIATINLPDDTSFIHTNLESVAGCYVVTAFDGNNNESIYSNMVCQDIDSCPTYQLPNVFTPNGDGSNDLFHPFPFTSVERIDIQIFNRWGKLIFETEDPQVLWDGKNANSKQDAPDGVYYYICDVYEKRLKGLTKRTLSGVVHLIR